MIQQQAEGDSPGLSLWVAMREDEGASAAEARREWWDLPADTRAFLEDEGRAWAAGERDAPPVDN